MRCTLVRSWPHFTGIVRCAAVSMCSHLLLCFNCISVEARGFELWKWPAGLTPARRHIPCVLNLTGMRSLQLRAPCMLRVAGLGSRRVVMGATQGRGDVFLDHRRNACVRSTPSSECSKRGAEEEPLSDGLSVLRIAACAKTMLEDIHEVTGVGSTEWVLGLIKRLFDWRRVASHYRLMPKQHKTRKTRRSAAPDMAMAPRTCSRRPGSSAPPQLT